MKVGFVTGFLFGAVLGTMVMAKAQFFDASDNMGYDLNGYTDPSGITLWQDNHGRNGSIYSYPSVPLPILPGLPCR